MRLCPLLRFPSLVLMKPLPLRPLRWLPFAGIATVLAASALSAQSSDVAIAVASLREDIRIIDERTRSLTVEMEQMRRENAGLPGGEERKPGLGLLHVRERAAIIGGVVSIQSTPGEGVCLTLHAPIPAAREAAYA